jgi:hypothetical protein
MSFQILQFGLDYISSPRILIQSLASTRTWSNCPDLKSSPVLIVGFEILHHMLTPERQFHSYIFYWQVTLGGPFNPYEMQFYSMTCVGRLRYCILKRQLRRDANTWKYLRRTSTFRAKALRREVRTKESLSLETSKFCLYFSGSCIPLNPQLSCCRRYLQWHRPFEIIL